MTTSKEALKSSDEIEVKVCQASMKSHLKMGLRALKFELAKKNEHGRFNQSEISNKVMKLKEKQLTEHFSIFLKLHDSFVPYDSGERI